MPSLFSRHPIMSAHELHLLSLRQNVQRPSHNTAAFSETCQTDMTFGIYLPPQVLERLSRAGLVFLVGIARRRLGTDTPNQHPAFRRAMESSSFSPTLRRAAAISATARTNLSGKARDFTSMRPNSRGGALSDVQPYQPRTARLGGTAFPATKNAASQVSAWAGTVRFPSP